MKKTAKLTCITALVAGAVAIGLDVWLDARPDSYTWSQWLLYSSQQTWGIITVFIVGNVLGFLQGHFFWPQKKLRYKTPAAFFISPKNCEIWKNFLPSKPPIMAEKR